MTLKPTIQTRVPAFRKFFLSDSSALWASLRRVSRVNFYQPRTGTFCLVPQLRGEDRPRGIIHRPGKHSTCQPFDIQLLNSNQGVAINQTFGQFVQEVSAPVPYLAMGSSNPLAVFLPFRVGAYRFGKLPLSFCKPLLSFAIVARVVDLLAVGQVDKMFKANVNANGGSGVNGNCDLSFNREANVPLAAFPLDLNGLDLTANRAVQLDLEHANPGEGQSVIVKRPAALRVGKAIIAVIGSESREACMSLRAIASLHTCIESLERLVYSVKNILQGLAVHVRKVRSDLLALYKSGRLLGKANTVTCAPVGIPAVLKGSVIQLSAQVKVMLQKACLPLGRSKDVLIGAACQHLNALLGLNILPDSFLTRSTHRSEKASSPQAWQFQQVRVSLSKVMGRASFYLANYIRCTVGGSHSDKQVDVVRHI